MNHQPTYTHKEASELTRFIAKLYGFGGLIIGIIIGILIRGLW